MTDDSMTQFDSPCCEKVATIYHIWLSSKSISQALTREDKMRKRNNFYARYPNSSSSRRSKYSFSNKISMHFLISGILGTKRERIWLMVSETSWVCFIFFRAFMMRTMADY